MIDFAQMRNLVVIPTLKEIPVGYSVAATQAVMMIIAHESKGGKYLKQMGGGPALGPIQMEPTTYYDTWKHGDSIVKNAMILGIIQRTDEIPPAEQLLTDLRLNVFMARQRLFMKPGALPEDIVQASKYLKQHWNSTGGKAHELSYANDYAQWSGTYKG